MPWVACSPRGVQAVAGSDNAVVNIDHAYAELGLPRGASADEVKAAWRRLVSRWHPDRNGSAEAVRWMQRINHAYEKIREAAFDPGPTETPAADTPHGTETPAEKRAEERPAGPTLRRKVRLTLEEAAFGCVRSLRGRLRSVCLDCAGSGDAPSLACERCDGAGRLRSVWFGLLASESDCRACEGSGRIEARCSRCAGKGQRSSTHARNVRIPPGVRSGDVLQAEGNAGEPVFELNVEFAAHPLFTPGDEGSVHCAMPVDGFAWLANGWIEVPTLAGLQQMRLQRGRNRYRLRGQGLPLERHGRERGDLIVEVQPSFPDRLDATQQALLDELARSADAGAAKPLRDWRERLAAWQRRSA